MPSYESFCIGGVDVEDGIGKQLLNYDRENFYSYSFHINAPKGKIESILLAPAIYD